MNASMKFAITVGTMALLAAGSFTAAAGTAEEAKAIWEKDCAKCHGADGKGDTAMGKKMKAKDLTDAQVQAKFTDEKAFKSIKEGVVNEAGKKTMPATKDVNDEQIKALTAFVRTLKK